MEQSSGRYARALRVIGQDLADLFPENLAIEHDGDNLLAEGLCSRSRLEAQEAEASLTGLKKIGAKLRAGILKPSTSEPVLDMVSFNRTYDPQEIDRLDQHGNAYRRDIGGMPEIYSLAERLRTIGKVIDGENGKIVRIFKDMHHISFEYLDADGKSHQQELDNTELYRLQRSYTTERTPTKISDLA
jgi:hypothetical protein